MGEDKNGVAMTTMGDVPTRRSTATETVPVAPSANAATQVQTIVDMKPIEVRQPKPKIEIKDLLAEPIQEKIRVQDLLSTPSPMSQPAEIAPVESSQTVNASQLDAEFVRDTVTDGTKVVPGQLLVQVWTLRNRGTHPWPAGCSVRYVGGDNMLNVDNSHPSSASDLAEATETNVIGRPVAKDEEISFRVLLKAPQKEGVSISYWRLKTPDGTPFGHRLWCHIDVSQSAAAPTTPPTLPSDPVEVAVPPAVSDVSAQEYSFQLMLLEQRNKRKQRLEEAREALRSSPRVNSMASENLADKLVALRKAAEAYRPRAAASNEVNEVKPEQVETQGEAQVEPKIEPKEEETPAKEESDHELRSKGSVMIFPQLEKESPASSTHEAQDVKPETQEAKVESAPAPSEHSDEHSEEDFFLDAESVDMMDGSSDDGFQTDEEYDILDASDEEQI